MKAENWANKYCDTEQTGAEIVSMFFLFGSHMFKHH